MCKRKAPEALEFKALWHGLRAPAGTQVRRVALERVSALWRRHEGNTAAIGAALGVTDRSARRLVAIARSISVPVRRRVTAQQVQRVRDLRADGWTMASIADDVGLALGSVSDILCGRTHKRAA